MALIESDAFLEMVWDCYAYNILTGRIDICKPLWWERTTSAMNDTDFNYLMLYLENSYSLNHEKRIRKALSVAAHQNQYHPIRDYLSCLEWDGTERIPYALHHFLGADVSDYTREVMKLFLMGAISRVFNPGCKFETMLCLVGGQGAGKSSFFRLLACRDEWFSDDLKRIDDENVFRKMQGHWIIEMSEMIATANAKSIEDIKSFLSRQKETYKVPYATEPEDRLRQCVFGGTSNALDFLPLDRSGNRRFLPIMVHPEQAEVHILKDETASRQYMDQLWAEAMTIYRKEKVSLRLSKEMNAQLVQLQKEFMPEDTKVGMLQAFLDTYNGDMVCSKLLHHEALGRFEEPKSREIREINEIMNQSITGWIAYPNPRIYKKYGKQRGWMRENKAPETDTSPLDGFQMLTEAECSQMEFPF
ncbi:MAG: virulence-associated protein E [Clostridia bacterium]|nr:virulence-associated protein E [Clostridia bacterium]